MPLPSCDCECSRDLYVMLSRNGQADAMPLDNVVLRLTLLTNACYVEQVWAGGRDAPRQC